MKTIRQLKEQVGHWLMRHWLTLITVAIAFLLFSVLLSGIKSEETKDVVQQVATENVLTKKQVKRAEKVIEQKKDSIRTQTVIIEKVIYQRDSIKVEAVKHDSIVKKLTKQLTNETAAESDALDVGFADSLANYKPKAYKLQDGTIIR